VIAAGDAVGRERMLFRVKHGHCAGFHWSPDGKILAFDNQRGDHSFIGLYRYEESWSADADGAIQWIHPSCKLTKSSVVACGLLIFSEGIACDYRRL